MAEAQYLVLARKWRPQTFEDVIGQEHITRTLQNAIATGRIGHAFLFIGSRGIGKTTTARILAKALNCLSFDAPTPHPCGKCDNCATIAEGNNIDVLEIDGASNRKIEDVREIRHSICLVPSHSRYKVYIIDEVHQLTSEAFNALLKTLEEPPPHAIFILATTQAHKIPATIISRCQRFDYRRVSIDRICALLRQILGDEGVQCSDEALKAIARAAEGSVRDAESILDQLLSYCDNEIAFKDVFDVLGLVEWGVLHELCDAILEKDIARQLVIVEEVVVKGKDLSQFVQEILRYFRNLLVLVCKTANAKELLALPDDEIAQMQAHADRFTLTNLIRLVEQFAELTKGFDSQLVQRTALEALLIRISKRAVEISVDTVLEKLMQLRGGAPTQAAPSRATAQKKTPPALTEATESNLASVWAEVSRVAGKDAVGLKIALSQAAPAGIDGETLVVRFSGGNAQARDIADKPEHRKALEDALAKRTTNLKRLRYELADDSPDSERSDAQPSLPVSRHIPAEQARAAMENRHVARVLDVFKGRIVDIKHH